MAKSRRAFSPPESDETFVSERSPEKPARAQAGAHLGLRLVRHETAQVLVDALGRAQFVELVLGEIGDLQLVGAHEAPRHRLQPVRDELEEGRLAVAVGAEQADPVVVVDAQVERPKDRLSLGITDRTPPPW